MTIEIVGMGGAYYKTTSNPESWNVTGTGTRFGGTGSPYCCVDTNGTVVLTCSTTDNLFINKNSGIGGFTQVPCALHRGYSRSITALSNGRVFLIVGVDDGTGMCKMEYEDKGL